MGFSKEEFREELLESIPNLRSFARSLCPSQDIAEDLLQESLLRAWEKRLSLRELGQLKPWLYTIMRNNFYSSLRKTKNEVEDPDGEYAMTLAISPAQESVLDLRDVSKALRKLPKDQQQSVMLICVEHMSYDEAAKYCGCAIGTLKSRVNRARAALSKSVSWDTMSPAV